MRRPDPELIAAVHEAGHAIAYMASGVPVDVVEIDRTGGGSCLSFDHDTLPPAARMLVAVAGGVAVSMLLDAEGDDHLSPADDEIWRSARLELAAGGRVNNRAVVDRSAELIAGHEKEVLAVANLLLDRRRLDTRTMANAVWQNGSRLRAFRPLYHKPEPPKPKAAKRPAQPAAGSGFDLFDGRNLTARTLMSATTARLRDGTASIPKGMTHAQLLAEVERRSLSLRRRR